MKIGIVAQYADPDRGGHEQFLTRLVEGILEHDETITFFARSFGRFKKRFPEVECIKVPTVPFPQSLRYYSFNQSAKLVTSWHADKYDVLFATGFVTFGDCYRAGGGSHEEFLKHQNTQRMIPKLSDSVKLHLQDKLFQSDRVSRVIVNSRMIRDELTEKYPALKSRIDIVYNGVDTDEYNPRNRTRAKKTIQERHDLDGTCPTLLFVGREPRRKGLDVLLTSLDGLQTSVNVIVAGIKQTDVPDSVQHTRHQIHVEEYIDDMVPYYRGADLTVLPTRYDPAANVVPESLACGTPVVTTENNGASEFITQGTNGSIIPSDNPEQLRETLNKFVAGNVEFARGWSPDDQFLEFLDISRTVEDTLDILRDIR